MVDGSVEGEGREKVPDSYNFSCNPAHPSRLSGVWYWRNGTSCLAPSSMGQDQGRTRGGGHKKNVRTQNDDENFGRVRTKKNIVKREMFLFFISSFLFCGPWTHKKHSHTRIQP